MEQNPDAEMIRIGSWSPILVSGPEALGDILNTHAYDFEKPWGLRVFLARAIGWGVIMAEGHQHKKQRKLLTPSFNIRRIRELYALMWDKTQIFLREVEKDIQKHAGAEDGFGVIELSEWARYVRSPLSPNYPGATDLRFYLSRLTLDIIGPTAVGRDFKSLTSESNPIADAFLELLRPDVRRIVFLSLHFMMPAWFVRLLPIKENAILDSIFTYLKDVCTGIIQEKKSGLAKSGQLAEHDILSRIIETGEFTDDELSDQMLTFLAAGVSPPMSTTSLPMKIPKLTVTQQHETTASALTWACYLCAKYPKIQKTLRAEIHQRIPSSQSTITWDLMESMPYLHGVCEETLRLYPTVPATIREAVRQTTVAGRVVPKGTDFLLVPYAINRHPNFWKDPHMIIPERWIDRTEDGRLRPNKTGGTTTNFSELTFLHGPRACIGRDFAKAELRCAVAGVIGKYEIQLHSKEEPRVQGVITMKPEGGLYLRFKPIQAW